MKEPSMKVFLQGLHHACLLLEEIGAHLRVIRGIGPKDSAFLLDGRADYPVGLEDLQERRRAVFGYAPD